MSCLGVPKGAPELRCVCFHLGRLLRRGLLHGMPDQAEGSVWRALGIMAAAGGLRNGALLLRELRMPDAAAAFCAACREAGFHSPLAPADAGAPHP